MYSAGTGESALDVLNDRDRDPNSVYTRHLLPLLKTPGLSLTDIAEQVRVSVRAMAATVQHRQTPAYYNQLLGRVCLAGGDCAPRVATLPPSQPTEAERAWIAAKDSTSIAALEAFIGRFGDTYYGDLAKVRVAELKQAEAAKRPGPAKKTDDDALKKQPVAMLKAEQDKQEPGVRTPLAMIQDVYSKLEFNSLYPADNPIEDSKLARSYFTPQFIALLRKNAKCWDMPGKEGYQMWAAGSDIGIKDLKLAVVDRTSSTQTILANFKNFTEDQVWSYKFRLFPTGWLIEDVLFTGMSLSKQMAKGCLG
jgi:hypothetical protein